MKMLRKMLQKGDTREDDAQKGDAQEEDADSK